MVVAGGPGSGGSGTNWEFTYFVSAPLTHLGFTGTFVNSNVGVTWPAVIRQEFFSSVSGTTITPSQFLTRHYARHRERPLGFGNYPVPPQ
jgi:hypothetical protein